MKGIEITEENLEDLLAYDDVFLDYFNAFLSLPAFPIALKYDRLTGTFREVIENSYSLTNPESRVGTPPYGATDEEKDRQLEWAKRQRLQLFLRTHLFREMKLSKLLLRPLEDRFSASRGSSRNLGAYSRQTDSFYSSLSNTGDNSGQYDFDLDEELGDFRRSQLFKYERPGSRALSLPPMFDGMFGDVSSEYTTSSSGDTHSAAGLLSKSPPKHFNGDGKLKKAIGSGPSVRLPPIVYSHGSGRPVAPPCSTAPPVITLGAPRSRGRTSPAIGPTGYPMAPWVGRRSYYYGFAHRKRLDTGIVTDSGFGGDNPSKSGGVTFTSKADALVSIRESESGEMHTSGKKKKKLRPGTPEFAAFERSRQFLQRAYSAPCNKREFSRIPGFDFDLMYGEPEPDDTGQVYVAFDDETSDRTFTDMKTHLEGKHKMTYQEMKEQVLGTTSGFEEFMSFLSDTSGIHLVNFWLDCEFFKDSMQDFDEVEHMAARNRLFRDIQDKYALNLTQDAKEQLVKSASHVGLSHTVFLRTQYDVLRRLRAYWLPRFIIHKERMEGFRCHQEENIWSEERRGGVSVGGFFPSISVVRSMPVRPEDLLQIASTKDWEKISMGGRRLDERIRSAHYRCSRPTTVHETDLRAKFVKALSTDKAAGGAFMSFLERKGQQMMINRLLLWQDVAEYCAAENRSSDRLLRLVHAQSIFNKYALCSSPDKLDFDQATLLNLRSHLLSAKDHVPASLFDEMKASTVDSLEQQWIRYLKEDLKKYLESSMSHRDSQSPPSTAEDIEVYIQDGKIIVRNPPRKKRSQGSHLSAYSVAESVDEVRLAEERLLRRERRKIMERERKKAVRAAKARLKEMKAVKPQPVPVPEEKLPEKPPEPVIADNVPVTFNDVSGNKTVMLLFRKCMLDQGESGKETVNVYNLHNELLGYQSISGNNAQKKKEIQATQIYKNFLDKQGKKPVALPEKLEKKLEHDKERPKSPTIKELVNFSKAHLDQSFAHFWETQASDLGLTSSNINKLSAVDVAMRTGDFGEEPKKKKEKGGSGKSSPGDGSSESPTVSQELTDVSSVRGSARKGKKGETKKKLGGRAQPSRDDKIEFLMELEQCAQGHLTLTMIYFYAYLGRWGEEDSLPFLDKDLIFYIEAQKFKENCHNDSDEEMMKWKVQSIMNCFLECTGHPSLQIDIPNECYNRTLRFCQKVLHGKETERIPQLANTFDDAQFVIFKALLPYWAGFNKHYSPPDDPRDVPLTKYQKMLRKRLEMFQRDLTPKDYRLPSIPPGHVAALSFSLLDGMKWKDSLVEDDLDRGSRVPPSRRGPSVSRGASSTRKASDYSKAGLAGPQRTATTISSVAASVA